MTSKIRRYIIIGFVALVIIAISITIAVNSSINKDNKKLTATEQSIQSNVQKATKNKSAKVVKILAESDSWKLVQLNLADQRSNYAMVITNNDKTIMGPASLFEINDLYTNNVPDKIIEYLYPDKPWWINFDDKLSFSYENNIPYVKAAIQSMAVSQGIELKSAAIDGDVNRDKQSSDSLYVETFTFKLVVNRDKQYTFQGRYGTDDFKMTYTITDQSGQVVYQTH